MDAAPVLPPDVLPEAPAFPPPNRCPADPTAVESARETTSTSDSIEPPVWPTLTPMLPIKLSIFCDTFRKATAQRNQISTFPVTASLPEASTWACTSSSVTANTGRQATVRSAATSSRIAIEFVLHRFVFIGTSDLQRQRVGDECANHGREQPQAPCVHQQQKDLTAQHPAPALEYV